MALYSFPAMWAIRSHTRLLYPNSLSYLSGRKKERKRKMAQRVGNKYLRVTSWSQTVPCDQLDEVVVEGDTGAGVKDGGVAVAVEVCGHNLRGEKRTGLSKSWTRTEEEEEEELKATWCSVYPRMPFMGPSAAAFTTFLMSSYLACRRGNQQQKVCRPGRLDGPIGRPRKVGQATHGLLQADRQVHHRHVGGGNAEGHAGQLAVGMGGRKKKKRAFRDVSATPLGSFIDLLMHRGGTLH